MEDVVLYGKKFTNQASVLQTQIDALTVKHQLLHVRDEKSSGTAGGTFTSGSFQTRVLNTVKTNEITGASLSSNQITLPAGTYDCEASAPAIRVDQHKAILYDVTNSADVLIGTSEYSANAATYASNRSFVIGRFTLTAETVLELRHRCTTTNASFGLGPGSTYAVVEVYSEVRIWRVA
jgi:hypothetical protein